MSKSEDTDWDADRQAVEFGVEIGEYRDVVRVPRRGAGLLLLDRVGFFRFACRIASLGLTRGVRTRRSFMGIRRVAITAAFGVGLATLPLSTAKAQYYPPCSPFPLEWPFCVVGAVVGTAAMIVTAPIRALTGAPPFYYGGYYRQPYYPPPAYYAPGYYPPSYYYGPR